MKGEGEGKGEVIEYTQPTEYLWEAERPVFLMCLFTEFEIVFDITNLCCCKLMFTCKTGLAFGNMPIKRYHKYRFTVCTVGPETLPEHSRATAQSSRQVHRQSGRCHRDSKLSRRRRMHDPPAFAAASTGGSPTQR